MFSEYFILSNVHPNLSISISIAACGGRTPYSVIIASMYSGGVTSNTGFNILTPGCFSIHSRGTYFLWVSISLFLLVHLLVVNW